MRIRSQSGAASVEHAALALLVALALAGVVAALAAGTGDAGRELGFSIARKLRCAAAGPGPCWRDPLTEAYGRPVAGAVRALAPSPTAIPAASGMPLLPVDFRRCRIARCAVAGPRAGLTASNRRVTAFVAVDDRRRDTGRVEITYWHYRPTLGWQALTRSPSGAEAARLAATPLLETQVPTLVALETLAGANHFDFPAGEQPPWRWNVERR